MQRLGSADVAWLRMETSTNPMVVVGILRLGRPLSLSRLEEILKERLLVIRRFRQRITDTSRPAWEPDPTFDISAHVLSAGLGPNASRSDLERFINRRLQTRLDLTMSPWEAHLVEDYEGGSAVVMVLHHAIADGIALVQVLLSLSDEHFDELDPDQLPSYGEGKREARRRRRASRRPSPVGSVGGGMLARVQSGLHLAGAAWHIATLRMDSETRFKQAVSHEKRAAWSEAIPLATVKSAGAAVGAKINDIVLTAIAGGLRRYFEAHGERVDDVEIGTVIPVNLRDPAEAFELGNEFGIVFLSLPIGIATARERLIEVQRRMDHLKGSGEPVVALGILKAIGAGPRMVHRKVVDMLGAKSSVVVTNVPGPTERLHVDGIPLTEIMYWAPRAGDVGLGISIISYDGTLQVGVASDVVMAPDPHRIVDGIMEEIELLSRVA